MVKLLNFYKDQQGYPRDITILNGWIYQEVPSGQ